ncbi:hypothetical protein [Deinococcus sedimenti]|uniref:Transposase n=1 Tax=Deinococcus sedimenti TaxID=1867090 RepID=A0ABQ2S9S4_9DEIO|nr:hypothetical protein [Deinococcus sedimenti]GGS09636.1 hypothetical protein GCM10008960_39880 [Deinococcus sedimenti]
MTKTLGRELVGIHACWFSPQSVPGFSWHALQVHLQRVLMVALGALHVTVST